MSPRPAAPKRARTAVRSTVTQMSHPAIVLVHRLAVPFAALVALASALFLSSASGAEPSMAAVGLTISTHTGEAHRPSH